MYMSHLKEGGGSFGSAAPWPFDPDFWLRAPWVNVRHLPESRVHTCSLALPQAWNPPQMKCGVNLESYLLGDTTQMPMAIQCRQVLLCPTPNVPDIFQAGGLGNVDQGIMEGGQEELWSDDARFLLEDIVTTWGMRRRHLKNLELPSARIIGEFLNRTANANWDNHFNLICFPSHYRHLIRAERSLRYTGYASLTVSIECVPDAYSVFWRDRRDCAFAVEDQDKPGFRGMSVDRVRHLMVTDDDWLSPMTRIFPIHFSVLIPSQSLIYFTYGGPIGCSMSFSESSAKATQTESGQTACQMSVTGDKSLTNEDH
ncbi:hypothetical protein DFH09DRAFT_1086360 [Mycena vulgaris]|nr:hypothetical protein DFH09DRAFT_1086360 [Mycena vulgaris]